MIVLPLQWDSHRGPDAIGQHKLVFTMDESVDSGKFNPMLIKKGTQFMVILSEVEKEEGFQEETPKETLLRFKKRFEALVNEKANILGVDHDKYRESIKKILKEKGLIKTSTTELDLNGYAKSILMLENKK